VVAAGFGVVGFGVVVVEVVVLVDGAGGDVTGFGAKVLEGMAPGSGMILKSVPLL